MSTKKEYTIEELQKQCYEAKKTFEHLNKLIEEKKKEEEMIREAKLEEEKDARKKEVDDALSNCKVLIKAYVRDYGTYSVTSAGDNDYLFNWFW